MYSDGSGTNNMRELGDLFEPYWQARIVPTPIRSRQPCWAVRWVGYEHPVAPLKFRSAQAILARRRVDAFVAGGVLAAGVVHVKSLAREYGAVLQRPGASLTYYLDESAQTSGDSNLQRKKYDDSVRQCESMGAPFVPLSA